MNNIEFDIAPFAFEAEAVNDELAWEDERGRSTSTRRASRSAAARPRPKPSSQKRPAPRRPWPASGLGLDTSAAPCTCPAHRSEYVRWVQSALNRVDKAGLRVDGVMSGTTRSALRTFQARQGLPADGIAGPDTEQALRDAQRPADAPAPPAAVGQADEPGELFEFETLEFESGASSMPTLRNGSRGTAVADLQRRLGAVGFSAGTADGIFGAQTDAAVRSFQRTRGLTADGIVGPMTWSALLNAAPGQPAAPPGGGSGAISYGKGWGGSEGVADAAKAIAASMGIPVTSEKRNLADTIRVGSTTGSDHYTGNTNAFATDFGVSGTRGDELARAIATKYGIPQSSIGTYNRTTIQVGDRRYSLQLLWKVTGHYDHVHLGIRRA